MLKKVLMKDKSQKNFSVRNQLQKLTDRELQTFKELQAVFIKLIYFIHYNVLRTLLIDLNILKTYKFRVIVYYVKKKSEVK